MKKLIILTLAILAFIQLQSQSTKYYYDYNIDLLTYEFKPFSELTEDEAKDTICNRFVYDDKGILIQIEGYAYGHIFTDSYFGVNRIFLKYEGDTLKLQFFRKVDEKNEFKLVLGREVVRNERGYREFNKNALWKDTVRKAGYFIKEVARINDREIELQYFDLKLERIPNNFGTPKKVISYNDQGLYQSISYRGDNGELQNNILGYALVKYVYDHKLNQTTQLFFNEDNIPVEVLPLNFHKRVFPGIQNVSDKNDRGKPYRFKDVEIDSQNSRNYKGEVFPNYESVIDIDTESIICNLFSLNPSVNDSLEHKKLIVKYYRNVDSLRTLYAKQAGINKMEPFSFFMDTYGDNEIEKKLAGIYGADSADFKIKDWFTGIDDHGISEISNYIGLASKACYGRYNIKGNYFFKWDDILFCVSPFHSGNPLNGSNALTIDYNKLPISEDIKHVICEGIVLNNFNPTSYITDANFIFNKCIIKTGGRSSYKELKKPDGARNSKFGSSVNYVNNSLFAFSGCIMDEIDIDIYSGNSWAPFRYYENAKFSFTNCKIGQMSFKSRFNDDPGQLASVLFDKSIINKLVLNGDFNSIAFTDTKIKDFYSVEVNKINKELSFKNTSFSKPLNFPELKLSDSAFFELQSTSYEAYMKFPWDEIKGKIYISEADDKLKAYRNLYNLLSLSYKSLSLIEEADDCYFTWKQFERKNYTKLFWQNEDNHWYSPKDLFRAWGYSAFNHINYFSCGYGIKPLWILPFTLFIVFIFALIYFFMPTSISSLEEHLVSRDKISKCLEKKDLEEIQDIFKDYDFDFSQNKQGLIEDVNSSISTDELMEKLELAPKHRLNLSFFWYCFYFSFSTFTTIGIGDWYPAGKTNKALVMIEGAIGWLCLGLFITTYANILLR